MPDHVVQIPKKLARVFAGKARYRGAYGGRGSGKTRSFAKMSAVRAVQAAEQGRNGIILACREFMNSLDESSMAEVKAAIQSDAWLSSNFEMGEKFIRTKARLKGRVEYKFAGLNRNLDSLKSKANIILAWVDEAEPVTEVAWVKLIPTVREHDSEIWVTWNPESERSATHRRFRVHADDDMKIVSLNWKDNPWFPSVLEEERLRDERERPEQYPHIWEGDFATVIEGAYYAEQLAQAERSNRICKLVPDPLMPIRVYHDLAFSSSDKADAYVMWIKQDVGKEQRWLGYYETVGQTLYHHVNWLRDWMHQRGIEEAILRLPHDGSRPDGLGRQYADHWREASTKECKFKVSTIPNQGQGAAMQRIEAARRYFPNMWFDDEGTKAGRQALAHYHERRDEIRGIGLGPMHDWASHAADAFGLGASDYQVRYGEVPQARDKYRRERRKLMSPWAR